MAQLSPQCSIRHGRSSAFTVEIWVRLRAWAEVGSVPVTGRVHAVCSGHGGKCARGTASISSPTRRPGSVDDRTLSPDKFPSPFQHVCERVFVCANSAGNAHRSSLHITAASSCPHLMQNEIGSTNDSMHTSTLSFVDPKQSIWWRTDMHLWEEVLVVPRINRRNPLFCALDLSSK